MISDHMAKGFIFTFFQQEDGANEHGQPVLLFYGMFGHFHTVNEVVELWRYDFIASRDTCYRR